MSLRGTRSRMTRGMGGGDDAEGEPPNMMRPPSAACGSSSAHASDTGNLITTFKPGSASSRVSSPPCMCATA